MTNTPSTRDSESNDLFLQQIWLPHDWSELNVAVALSGGADSVSLLCGLQQLKQKQGGAGRLFAMHVNHQLRGQQSDEDARWCRQQCEELKIPLEILSCQSLQRADQVGDGIEAAAREQRYRLMTAAAEQQGVRYLATAHTQDDQVETILFRILRGTGLRGLAGIPQSRSLTPALTVIRPLLDCTRELVISYLSSLGQEFRTDESNTDCQFTRNRLRHELLPLLRVQYNQDVDHAILRLAMQADEAQHMIEYRAEVLLKKANVLFKSDVKVSVSLCWQACGREELAVVREALRLAWRQAGLAEQAMTHQWWGQLAELAQNPDGEVVFNLPGNVRASIVGDRLLLETQ